MPRYPKNHKDVEYYVRGRKRRVSGSTVATERFLVMVVPQAVDDSMKDMGKASTFGRIHDNHISYRAKGYKDGTEFDPTTRLSGMPERAAIGG